MGHPFDIQRRKKGDVVILDLVGDLTLGEPEQLFRSAFAECVSRKQSHVIVNLESVEFMDSSGVGEILRLFKLVRDRNGEVVLINPNQKLHNQFTMYRFEKFMKIRDSVEAGEE